MAKTHTPRCIVIRHGQTEWSKSGQYTGLTDLPLTEYGVGQMRRTGAAIFSAKYIDPAHITYVFTSPRQRARKTVDLVLESLSEDERARIQVVVDEDLREWEYGDYEGLLTSQIIELRRSRGLDCKRPWNIWRDGCENGESTQQVGLRLSRVIARIQALHRQHQAEGRPSDILVFAHGHALRYFSALWMKMGVEAPTPDCAMPSSNRNDDSVPLVRLEQFRYLQDNPNFLLDAGGIGVLSYAHHNIDEPALALAGAFVCPPQEESQHDG
ncbi:ADR323Cp [Eremothecium gossypii ATCC 10895]|uniref:ADR323Cp n=1 Tax=Eremothecium gossypii (strain ATCC 10895 / CBS 109.51 / FGSC 9923 / NRRL Y-1056) TaxID=284811 RepID=Q759F3_EREGS|nr:ADR323Cp [Eremothecium gossypii ATCC 10895]AAS52243.1 ADR323Cp [Eremothecium gossypii ATCC 10895]AEY96542.1 FADR323Cp [Eremothecium gossypii FDAG1]